jgi:hypothetical protein
MPPVKRRLDSIEARAEAVSPAGPPPGYALEQALADWPEADKELLVDGVFEVLLDARHRGEQLGAEALRDSLTGRARQLYLALEAGQAPHPPAATVPQRPEPPPSPAQWAMPPAPAGGVRWP